MKKFVALFCAFALVFNMVPATTFASGVEGESPAVDIGLLLDSPSVTFTENSGGPGHTASVSVTITGADAALVARMEANAETDDGSTSFSSNISGLGNTYTLVVTAPPTAADGNSATVTLRAYGGESEDPLATVTLSVNVIAPDEPPSPVTVSLSQNNLTFTLGGTLTQQIAISLDDEDDRTASIRASIDADPTYADRFYAYIDNDNGDYLLMVSADGTVEAENTADIIITVYDSDDTELDSTTLHIVIEAAPYVPIPPVMSGLPGTNRMYADDPAASFAITVRDENTPVLDIAEVKVDIISDSNAPEETITAIITSTGEPGEYTLTIRPQDTVGTVDIRVRATNTADESVHMDMTVTVDAALTAPHCATPLDNVIYEVAEDTDLTVQLSGNADDLGKPNHIVILDPDSVGYTLKLDTENEPVNGTATLDGTSLAFSPDENHFTAAGDYSATVSLLICYTKGGTDHEIPLTVRIKVTSDEDNPSAGDYTLNALSTDELITLSIDNLLSVCSTVEPGDVAFVEYGTPVYTPDNSYKGTLRMSADEAAIELVPNIRYVGTITIPYTIKNAGGDLTATADIIISMGQGANAVPTINAPSAISTDEDANPDSEGRGTYTFDFLATDLDIWDLDDLNVTVRSGNEAVLPDGGIALALIDDAENNSDTQKYRVDLAFTKDANTSVRYGNLDLILEAVDDKGGSSGEIRIPVAIAPVNDAPTLTVDAGSITGTQASMIPQGDTGTAFKITMQEDSTTTFQFTVSDVDLPLDSNGDPVTSGYQVFIVSGDTGAKVFASSGFRVVGDPVVGDGNTSLTYMITVAPKSHANTHQVEFLTDDIVFTLYITDSVADQETLSTAQNTVAVDVQQINDPPVAVNDPFSIKKDDVCWFDVMANDIEHDGKSTIHIESVQTTGSTGGGAAASSKGGTVEILNDPDDDNAQKIYYIPPTHFVGTDTFTYTITDGEFSSTATVTVSIAFVNHKPEYIDLKDENDPYEMDEDEANPLARRITFRVYDDMVADEGRTLKDINTIVVATTNSNLIGDINVLPVDDANPDVRTLQITPALNKNSYGDKLVRLKITIGDGEHLVDRTVSLRIEPVNDKPTANPLSLSYKEGEVGNKSAVSVSSILGACSDVDSSEGDKLYLVSVAINDSTQGSLIIDESNYVDVPGTIDGSKHVTGFDYIAPSEYFDEAVEITFVVRDQAGLTDEATLTLSPIKKNDKPIFLPIASDTIIADEDGQWKFPIQFKDPETERDALIIDIGSANEEVVNKSSLKYDILSDAEGETILDFTGGAMLTITPRKDQFSDAPFNISITVSDGTNRVSQTVSLTVRAVPDKPNTPLQEFSTRESTTLTFNPLLDVTDPDPGDSFKLTAVTFTGGADEDGIPLAAGELPGTLTTSESGACTFTPDVGFVGELTFSYTVNDSYHNIFMYPETFGTEGSPGYPSASGYVGYDDVWHNKIYNGESVGVLTIQVGDTGIGPSLQRLKPVVAYAGQEMPVRDLFTKNIKPGNVYTLQVEVIGGPVDPASIRVNGKDVSTQAQEFTATEANPIHNLGFQLKPGVTGRSIVRFTIRSMVDGKPTVNTMSFSVTTHSENQPPTFNTPITLAEPFDERTANGTFNKFEIDVIGLAGITDPEAQKIMFREIGTSGAGDDQVSINQKGDGSYVLEYHIQTNRSGANGGLHTVSFTYTVYDEGGKSGVAADNDQITTGTVNLTIKSENHIPYNNSYITVASWDGDYITLERDHSKNGNWVSRSHDYDGDDVYLVRAWCLAADNDGVIAATNFTEYTEDELGDLIRFMPASTAGGWIRIRYQVKSRFENNPDNPWDYSSGSAYIDIYIPPKGGGATSLIPPKATGGWVQAVEDVHPAPDINEGYNRGEITGWLFGDGSLDNPANPKLTLRLTGTTAVGAYKIMDAKPVREGAPGSYKYYIYYKLEPNVNSYTNATGDMTDSLSYAGINFRIWNEAEDDAANEDHPYADGTFTVRITPVNDAPIIATEAPDALSIEQKSGAITAGVADGNNDITASISLSRLEEAIVSFKITDVDYPTQALCDKQISVSLVSGDDLVVASNRCIYTPPENGDGIWQIGFAGFLPGEADLVITAYDDHGEASANIATIHVTVTGTNTDPNAFDHYAVFSEDTTAAVKVFYEDDSDHDSDPDGDPVEIVLETLTHAFGFISVEGDKIIFTPNTDFCHTSILDLVDGTMDKPDDWKDGEVIAIDFHLEDSVADDPVMNIKKGISETKTLYIHFNPTNDAPRFIGVQTAQEVMEVTPETAGQTRIVSVTIIDVDDNAFDADMFSCAFVPDAVFEEHAANILGVSKNADGTFTVTIAVEPNTYACHQDSDAPSQLVVTAWDASGDEASATLNINVRPINNPPMFKKDGNRQLFGEPLYINPTARTVDGSTLRTHEDTAITIDITDYYIDADGDPIRIQSLTALGHGEVQYSNNQAVFTPNKDYFTPLDKVGNEAGVGADYSYWGAFTYTLTDNVMGTVYILIDPVNDAPTAKAITRSMDEDDTLEITDLFSGIYNASATIWDVDNDRKDLFLTYVGNSQTDADYSGITNQGGHVAIRKDTNGRNWEIVYTPGADFNGTDFFYYGVSDGPLTTYARVTVTVASEDDPPRANFEGSENWKYGIKDDIDAYPLPIWTLYEDTPKTFEYSVWDPEGRGVTATAEAATLAGTTNCSTLNELLPLDGIQRIGNDLSRQIKLTPATHKYGDFTLHFVVSDGIKESTYAIRVRVLPVNDAPAITGHSKITTEDTAFTGSITATDIETAANGLVFSLDESRLPARGIASVAADGSYSYTPTTHYFGTDTFWIRVTDTGATGQGDDPLSSYAEIKVTILPTNDAPSVPASLTITDVKMVEGHYMGGESIALSWTGGTDTFNETKRADLGYEIQYTPDTTATNPVWTPVDVGAVNSAGDGAAWTGVVPGTITQDLNTAHFGLRIRTKDDGLFYIHSGSVATDILLGGTTADPLSSGWAYFGVVKIDSAAPALSHTLSPAGWTNGAAVTINLAAAKGSLAGASDIARIEAKENGSFRTLATGSATASYAVDENGTYIFRAFDAVGNETTFECSVTVSTIDRIAPAAEVVTDHANGKTMDTFPDDKPHVLLAFTDPAATEENKAINGHSLVATKQYQIIPGKDQSYDDNQWVAFTNDRVDFSAKGSYTLYTRAADNAGNVTITPHGNFIVDNAPPVAQNGTLALYEHTVGENHSIITQALSARDGDGDTLIYTLVEDPIYEAMLDYVKVEKATPANAFIFTHLGGPVPDGETSYTLSFTVTDGTDVSNTATLTLTLVRVNDAPTAPDDFAIDTDSIRSHYRQGDSLLLGWADASDEETPTSALVYELEYTLNGNDWTEATITGTGATDYTFTAPGGNTDKFALRICTQDNNSTYINLDGSSGPAASAWVTIGPFKLDNTPPTATHNITSEDHDYAIVVITPSDGSQAYQSGVKAITPPSEAVVVPGIPYQYRIPATDTYTFVIYDNAGNSTNYLVSAKAPTDPVIAIDKAFVKQKDVITVSWTHEDNSVAVTNCHYQLQVTYQYKADETVWQDIIAEGQAYTQKTYNFTVPDGTADTDSMRFRVLAWDDKDLPSANWSTSDVIICDSTPPTVEFEPDTNAMTNGDVTVTCTITDSPAGIVAVTEDMTGSYSGSAPGNDNRLYSYVTTYTFAANGTVTVEVVDRCGNRNVQTFTVGNIDTDLPSVQLKAVSQGIERSEGAEVNYPYTFTLTFGDTGVSGIAERKYAITGNDTRPTDDSGIWQAAGQAVVTQERGALGDYYIHMCARDNAGNEIYDCFGPYHVVNTLPVAESFGVEVQEGGSVRITLRASDGDPGDSIASYRIDPDPLYGTLVEETLGIYIYTHNGADPISDTTFSYTAKDQNDAESGAATVTIRVIEVNDPPTVAAREPVIIKEWNTRIETDLDVFDPDHNFEDLYITFRSSDIDILPNSRIQMVRETSFPDGRGGVLHLALNPVSGAYTTSDPLIITITVRDPKGATATETIEVIIEPSPLPPTAGDQYYFVVEEGLVSDQVKAVLGFMGENLSYSFDTSQINAIYGSLTPHTGDSTDPSYEAASDPAFRFEATAVFTGDMEMIVPVTITQKNEAPFSDILIDITLHFCTQAITFENKESDIVITTVPALTPPSNSEELAQVNIQTDSDILRPENCELKINSEGALELHYRHEDHSYGLVHVTITMQDGKEITIPILIKPINDAPDVFIESEPAASRIRSQAIGSLSVLSARLSRGLEIGNSGRVDINLLVGSTLTGNLSADDSKDNNPPGNGLAYDQSYACAAFGYEAIVLPEHGTLSLESDGSFIYTPEAGFLGTDTFSVLISEAWGHVDNQNPGALPSDVADASASVDIGGTGLPPTGAADPADPVPLLARIIDVRITVAEPDKPGPVNPAPEKPIVDNTGRSGSEDNDSTSTGATSSGDSQPLPPSATQSGQSTNPSNSGSLPQPPAYSNGSGGSPDAGHTDLGKPAEDDPTAPASLGSDIQPDEEPAASHQVGPVRLPLWQLSALLLTGLLILIAWSHIHIQMTFEDGSTRALRKFGRIRHGGDRPLHLIIDDAQLPDNLSHIHIRFGWFYRRNGFYERPITLLYGRATCPVDIPDKQTYKQGKKGMHISSDAFVCE